ncbi:FAD-linked oxidase C-terminal domain-containing protein [Lutibacter sp. TH_r2]|uniref:FAD-binding and (Fe-S)-binding domain-containing protein n=1 Tax=Lutibacter sp. TH_r2 TaxID=3082083 RepID=UPI0029554C78|nr:FAD-linked oxidase C-terminal domain-containing protein [Lutibacter sp. TH_r2]MDV7187380.1 FAD-linked oxidase C-terminal domain-containing protein [Lutibacter sp. TH_r2]
MIQQQLKVLSSEINGELVFDNLHKSIYATDASVYRKIPLAVAFPKNNTDLKILINFASKNNITLIPRAAGTSLAGQCVGDGIVVDVSKHFTKILKFDEHHKTITVQPGVIRDELNLFLKPYKLFFSPNTSTSNRCMIGGMVGNNSSGTTSIQYGVTRDKVIQLKTILSDGSEAIFNEVSNDEFNQKKIGNSLENQIYKSIFNELSSKEVQQEIINQFPKKEIHRRNTGYAIDALINTNVFNNSEENINIAKLLCGSEGTLAFTTEITLKLDDLPPTESMLVAAHFTSIEESLKAVVLTMQHNLHMCELMDKTILDCTKNNREQLKNRDFVEGDPAAILMLEVKATSKKEVEILAQDLIKDLQNNNFGYAFPVLKGEEIQKAVNLRKAGLGLLGNIIGDKKAVACIEDTAVEMSDLPNYISEFSEMMKKYNQNAVYYAHAGAGEIHLRPILNLKKNEDVALFRTITTDVAKLVKKYRGSFSGEHGDGIVRAEFIPLMIGTKNYDLLKRIKADFDPNNIFNKGKIVDAFPMDKSLRYEVDRIEPDIETIQDFTESEGILKVAEKCNGSGDCRKPVSAGGTMCPSYRATKNEKDTTRARANALREFLTNSDKINKFDYEELKDVFDLCLSCKACASECPSNVDIAALKAEFLHQYYKSNKPTLRTKLFAENVKYNKLGSIAPFITNVALNNPITKKIIGIAPKRSIPKLYKTTLKKWYKRNVAKLQQKEFKNGEVYLFCDEFTNYYDVEIGIDAIKLLTNLGYKAIIVNHEESGRSAISKGFLDKAKIVIDKNIETFKNLISEKTPLIGIEPSAILGFRDEYLRLADDKTSAKEISKNTFTFEEFIKNEFKKGNISSELFTSNSKELKIHVHCQQKSLSSSKATFEMLNIPTNYKPVIMNTGCCGMAGSFGYEKEHYNVSMQVGEDTLFPKIRNTSEEIEISAAGTSCRHQIYDGTKRTSKHPITLLKEALK